MNITHHLTDETLLQYASGNLNEALEVVVASHLTLCPHCRQRSDVADEVGGQLLCGAQSTSVALSASQILDQARAGSSSDPDASTAIEIPSLVATSRPDTAGLTTDVPRPLARKLPADLDALPWKFMAKGIKQYNLGNERYAAGAFKLLKLEPGVKLIEHSHSGLELTLVLKGSYTDSTGQFRKGDVADHGTDVTHCPVIDDHETCIALVATESPANYTGLMGKIMQPLIGI